MIAEPRRVRSRHRHCLMAALLVLPLGCGGDSDGSATGPSNTGNLLVTVSTTDGAVGTIHVTGPAGYSHELTATTTLTGLAVGTYAVRADSAELPDSIVGAAMYSPSVTAAAPSISKGQTTESTVTYAPAHRRGALWMANVVPSLIEDVAVDRLRATGTALPSSESFQLRSYGIAFDTAGNMWAGSVLDQSVAMFTVAQRQRAEGIAPAVVLQSPDIIEPLQLAFDKHGTLWIVDSEEGLLGFTAAQLASGASPVTPAYHVRDTLSTNPLMWSVAFDSEGNAWVGYDAVKQLVEFTADQLTISEPQAPAKRLTPVAWGIPKAMSFDSQGNLWVADYLRFKILSFTPTQLASGGSPTPNVKLDVEYPCGLAFDNSGSLWVSDDYAGAVYRFSPFQLTVTGSPTPAATITVNNGNAYSDLGALAFDQWAVAPVGSIPTIPEDRAHQSRASQHSP
jgi:sugar lactone lactonase YvrE